MFRKLLDASYCLALSGVLLSCASRASAADIATVSSFNEPVDYGHVPSTARGVFPFGVVATTNLGYSPHLLWRWLGQRETGRFIALAEEERQRGELRFPVELKGNYTVQFRMPEAWRGSGQLAVQLPLELNVKSAQDKEFGRIEIPNARDEKEWISWKKLDVTGQTIVIGHRAKHSTTLNGIRFVPGDGGATVTWQGAELLERARRSNVVHEDHNPADAAARMESVFKQVKAMHMNTVLVANITSPEAHVAVLDLGQQYDLKVIVDINEYHANIESRLMEFLATPTRKRTDPNAGQKLVEERFKPVIEKIKDHPALLAYYMYDEPFWEEAQGYRVVHDYIRRLDPKHPVVGYLCRAAWDVDEGTYRGIDNMKRFVEGAGAEVLFNDLYPIRIPASDSAKFMDRYAEALDDNVRQAAGRPLWIAPQSIGYYKNVLRPPTPAEIRVQAYLSAAYGATGILYYNYNSMDSILFDAAGEPQPTLIELGQVAEEFSRLIPTLLTLQRVKITGQFPMYLDVQGFRNKDGQYFLMVVNKDVNARRSFDLILPTQNISRVVDKKAGKTLPLSQNTVQLELAPGDGTLLQLQ